jgi:glucuronide carrier protein
VAHEHRRRQGIGGALGAGAIGIGGYVAGASTQSGTALDTIRIVTGVAPAVFVGIAVVMLAYPLTEERFRELVGEVAMRRARRDAVSAQAG